MKVIDRNIFSQLYNKIKGLHIVNNVLQQESGGTGSTSLSDAYSSMVIDTNVTQILAHEIHMFDGYTLGEETSLVITVNKKSMYLEGIIVVHRDSAHTSRTFAHFTIDNGGYKINNIKVATYDTRISILDNVVTLSANFDTDNIYRNELKVFVPFI